MENSDSGDLHWLFLILVILSPLTQMEEGHVCFCIKSYVYHTNTASFDLEGHSIKSEDCLSLNLPLCS